MSDSWSWEVAQEPIAQLSQALEVLMNVCKISSTVRVNKNQCKRIADRFNAIAKVLNSLGLDKDYAGSKASDGCRRSNKDVPAFDELLTMLRKGEALVSYYTAWKGIIGALSRTDNREAFLEIHQELDTLDSQFQFQDPDDKYNELAFGHDRSALLTEDSEKDLKEMPEKLEELGRIDEDPTHAAQEKPDLHLKTLQQVVSEKSKPVGEDWKLPYHLRIDSSSVEIKDPVRELVRQSKQDPTDRGGSVLVHNGTWLGCEFAVKVFKSGDQSEWNKKQLLKEVGALMELRHPHVIRLVGFGQDSERSFFLMEKMDADLRNFMMKKLEPAPRPKLRPFTRSKELDVITQIAKGMYYLHTQQYVHGDLKCTNILVRKSGDYLEVQIADLRNAMKLDGVWDQAAFETACSTRRPRWTAPEAIHKFGGVKPSPDSLRKSDVYSFAMTCYEVVTGKYPFDGIKAEALLEQIEAGVRPELPGELDGGLRGLITSCWDPDPNSRPHFESICHLLVYIRSKQYDIGTSMSLGPNSKSSGKDVVQNFLRRISEIYGVLTGLLGRVPAPESSSWNDQKKGQELQRISSTITFPEHLRIKPSDLKRRRKIGSGAFAGVYEATWLGCTFAVKRFRSKTADLEILTRELEFLISLRHPYVVQLMGLSVRAEGECMIVMELMSGNLRELIESRQRKRKLFFVAQDTSSAAPQLADVLPFDLREAVFIIWKIALGMAFLHSRGVMHRDLNSSNVLVNEYPGHIDVKIVDVGLSEFVSKSETHGAYVGAGTGFYRAPEILLAETADRSSMPNLRAIDVYAFGMTCYEVITGRVPCNELSRSDYHTVMGGYRPTLPSDPLQDLKVLIEKCRHRNPEQRPRFTYICEEILRIRKALLESISNTFPDRSTHVEYLQKSNENKQAEKFQSLSEFKDLGELKPLRFGTDIRDMCPAYSNSYFQPAGKRVRPRNWSLHEIRFMLELREETTRVDVGPGTWAYVSRQLLKRHGFDRASYSCQQRWDTLLKGYKAILNHESKIQRGMSDHVSYWKMNADERSNEKLSRAFDLKWCEMIERILSAKPIEEGTRRIQMDSSSDGVDTQSEAEGLSSGSTATIDPQARSTADSYVPRTNHSHEPCCEVNLHHVCSERSSAATLDSEDHDLTLSIDSVDNKEIEDALRKPVTTGLRSREEEDEDEDEERPGMKRQKVLVPGLNKTRVRAANWKDDEKTSFLILKLRFLVTSVQQSLGQIRPRKTWSHLVSEQLNRNHKTCEQQWDCLVRSFKAIHHHESKIKEGTITHTSFWQMTEYQKDIANKERRSAKLPNLPRVFPREWWELIEFIFQIQDADKKIPSWMNLPQISSKNVEFNLSSSSTPHIAYPLLSLVSSQGCQRAEDNLPGFMVQTTIL